jgi:hypothetical protein
MVVDASYIFYSKATLVLSHIEYKLEVTDWILVSKYDNVHTVDFIWYSVAHATMLAMEANNVVLYETISIDLFNKPV